MSILRPDFDDDFLEKHIGVRLRMHRIKLLDAVKQLREHNGGGTMGTDTTAGSSNRSSSGSKNAYLADKRFEDPHFEPMDTLLDDLDAREDIDLAKWLEEKDLPPPSKEISILPPPRAKVKRDSVTFHGHVDSNTASVQKSSLRLTSNKVEKRKSRLSAMVPNWKGKGSMWNRWTKGPVDTLGTGTGAALNDVTQDSSAPVVLAASPVNGARTKNNPSAAKAKPVLNGGIHAATNEVIKKEGGDSDKDQTVTVHGSRPSSRKSTPAQSVRTSLRSLAASKEQKDLAMALMSPNGTVRVVDETTGETTALPDANVVGSAGDRISLGVVKGTAPLPPDEGEDGLDFIVPPPEDGFTAAPPTIEPPALNAQEKKETEEAFSTLLAPGSPIEEFPRLSLAHTPLPQDKRSLNGAKNSTDKATKASDTGTAVESKEKSTQAGAALSPSPSPSLPPLVPTSKSTSTEPAPAQQAPSKKSSRGSKTKTENNARPCAVPGGCEKNCVAFEPHTTKGAKFCQCGHRRAQHHRSKKKKVRKSVERLSTEAI